MRKILRSLVLLFFMVAILLTVSACANTIEPELFNVEYITAIGGYIDGDNNQYIEKGNDGKPVVAVANEGYVFLQWSDGETNPERQEKNVQKNIDVAAYFEQDITKLEKFSVTYIAGEGGVIVGDEEQLIPLGRDASSVIAGANTGYDFIGWSDGVKDRIRHDKNIVQEIKVTAYFKKLSFEVNYYESEGGKIEGELTQTITYGNNTTEVTAVPNMGYKFVRWSDNKSTNPVRTDSNVSKNINATAEFAYVLADGQGTLENSFLIETYEQFLDITQYPTLHYKLANDLDLSGVNHVPLFDGTTMFDGIFDGNGYTISNMTVDTYMAYPSLFGYIYKGVIKNLNITNFEIIVPNYNTANEVLCVGAIAGGSWGIIENIYAKGIIHGSGFTYDGVAIGGLVGQAGNAIKNCTTDVIIEINNVTSSNTIHNPFNIGGLTGVGFANITSCEVLGTISVTQAHNNVMIGGLIGYYIVDGTDNLLGKLDIEDCITYIEIFNGNGSLAHSAGLIADVIVYWGMLKIKNCAVYGNITDGHQIGGFIKNIKSYGTSDISITNSCVENIIIMFDGTKGGAAGFIYLITNDSNNGSVFEIVNCYSQGSIVAAMVGGFCYTVLDNITFYRCYSSRNIQSQAMTAGFIFQLAGGIVEECFSIGTITVTYQAAGFIFTTSGNSYILNCYSTSDVFITNTDPDTEWRTFASGFVLLVKGNILNCYSSGKISGYVYTTSEASGLGSIIGDFAGTVDSQIINCHVLYYEDTFATDIIARQYVPDEFIDLTVYNDVSQMTSLADILNEGLDEPVWINNENGLPQLIFYIK